MLYKSYMDIWIKYIYNFVNYWFGLLKIIFNGPLRKQIKTLKKNLWKHVVIFIIIRLWKLKRSKPTLITRHAAAMITVFSAAESVRQRRFRKRVKNLFGSDEVTTAAKPERCAGGRILFPCRSRLVSSFPSVVSLVIWRRVVMCMARVLLFTSPPLKYLPAEVNLRSLRRLCCFWICMSNDSS